MPRLNISPGFASFVSGKQITRHCEEPVTIVPMPTASARQSVGIGFATGGNQVSIFEVPLNDLLWAADQMRLYFASRGVTGL